MSDQEVISNGFLQTTVIGSIDPTLPNKKKRNLPGNPDPEAEVIALSPKTLMATNRFLCEICGKGFQRDQNLQLHRRGHNLPWKLKQRTSKEPRKRVYVCPEKTCVHHHPSRALGDLTGIKKHFCRKHGEKTWKCEKCNKRYAVQSDWKAHSKTCGTREYKCDCGTIFSRRDSFITHRAFCDALAEETARINTANAQFNLNTTASNLNYHHILGPQVSMEQHVSSIFRPLKDEITIDQHQIQRSEFPLRLASQLTPNAGFTDALQNPTNNIITIQPHNLHQHQLNSATNPLNFLNTPPIIHGSNPQPNNNNYPNFNWVLRSNNKTTHNPPINNHNQEESTLMAANNTTSLPSMYSYQNPQTPSTHIMSATALLQKATQIGAATPNNDNKNDAFVIGNFGSGDSLFGTSNSTISNVASDAEGSSVDDLFTITTMYSAGNNPAKRQKLFDTDLLECTTAQCGVGGGVRGQTRDFLGVGSQPVCLPSSINGWI